MVITEYEHWLVVRQSRRRRIYRVRRCWPLYLERYVPQLLPVSTVPAEQGGWFHATTVDVSYQGACVSLRDVYTARVARSGAWGSPGIV